MSSFTCVCGHSSVNHAFGTCNEWNAYCKCKKLQQPPKPIRRSFWFRVINKGGFAVGFVRADSQDEALVSAVKDAHINDTSHVQLMNDEDQDHLDRIHQPR